MKVGVVGTGGMGNVHSRHWGRIEGVALYAFDLDGEKLAKFCETHGAHACAGLEELLGKVDAVDICLPTHLHKDIALEAIGAGKAVLVEKPMGRTVADCRAIVAAAEKAGTLLSVGHVVRFFPEHKKVHELVVSGAVGNPAAVRMRRGGKAPTGSGHWFQDFDLSGGVILDLAIHEFDWLRWTLGEVTKVFSQSVRFGDNQVKSDYVGDYSLTTLSFENGAVAHVEGTWMDPSGFRTTLEVSGSTGMIEFDSRLYPTLRVHTEGGSIAQSQMDSGDDPYYGQLCAFEKAYREGTPPFVSGLDGLRAVAIAEAALESARTGCPVVPARE